MSITINKIKYGGRGTKVRIEYDKTSSDGMQSDEYTMNCSDQPRPEFEVAMRELNEDVRNLCDLPDSFAGRIKATGVSISHTEEILGAVVTAHVELSQSNAPLIINTPHLPKKPYGDGDPGSPVLPGEMVDHIVELANEAVLYVGGERAQMKLDYDAKKDDAESVTISVHSNGKQISEELTLGQFEKRTKLAKNILAVEKLAGTKLL